MENIDINSGWKAEHIICTHIESALEQYQNKRRQEFCFNTVLNTVLNDLPFIGWRRDEVSILGTCRTKDVSKCL